MDALGGRVIGQVILPPRRKRFAYPRIGEYAPADLSKRARKAAGVHGAKAAKAFRRAHRADYVKGST
jgi:hypothetical protein